MRASADLIIASTWSGEPIGPHEQVRVHLRWNDEALTIEIDAPFHDDPPPTSDRLWEHEVVELFVASGEAYTEIELGPHGQFLVLRFQGSRNRTESGIDLEYISKVDGARWTGRARVARRHLPSMPWRVNAYAIHGEPRRYLAWSPGEGAPDFHQLGSFRQIPV